MLANLHIPAPASAEVLVGVCEVIGALALVLGIYAQIASILLAIFMVGISFAVLTFWSPGDPAPVRAQKLSSFAANIAIVGGLIYVVAAGSGRLALIPPPDATPVAFYLSGEKCGHIQSLNDGSLVETPPGGDGGETSWSYPDAKWMAGVTTFDRQGMPDHFARVVTYTTPQFDRDREFTGQGVLELHASSDQIDMDVMVKLSLLPQGEDKPRFMKVSQGWLWASHRAEDADLTSDMRPFLNPTRPGLRTSHRAAADVVSGPEW